MVGHQVLKAFIQIYRAAFGWKAVYLVWDADAQMHEPHATSYTQYKIPVEAYSDAEEMAADYGVPFIQAESHFYVARSPGNKRLTPGWYRCPNVPCGHAFPSKSQPNSCPQCGYTERKEA